MNSEQDHFPLCLYGRFRDGLCGAAFQTPADPYWDWVFLSHFDFEF